MAEVWHEPLIVTVANKSMGIFYGFWTSWFLKGTTYLRSFSVSFSDGITEKDELQDEEHLKRIAPPPTANTDGAIGLISGLGIHRVNINGASIAIF